MKDPNRYLQLKTAPAGPQRSPIIFAIIFRVITFYNVISHKLSVENRFVFLFFSFGEGWHGHFPLVLGNDFTKYVVGALDLEKIPAPVQADKVKLEPF